MKLPLKKEEAPGPTFVFYKRYEKRGIGSIPASWGTDWLEFNIPHVRSVLVSLSDMFLIGKKLSFSFHYWKSPVNSLFLR